MPTAQVLGTYRKSHIPEGPGYHEKFYFSPGDTGFKVWPTRFGTLGVAVCWDQWFPEGRSRDGSARRGTAFLPDRDRLRAAGSEIDSNDHWQRAMQGHAAANVMPLIASNRIGEERGERFSMTFYGSSFIADHTGAMVRRSRTGTRSRSSPRSFDLEAIRSYRRAWGLFRDRRPDLYGPLTTLDGASGHPR